jgi:hypothetical protein
MRRLTLPLLLMLTLLGGCWRFKQPTYVDAQQAHTIYSAALDRAQLAEKPVFILFTQDEFWCQKLENYLADKDVARVLDKYFILISLRIDAMVGAEQMYYERGGDRGVPAYKIVDPRGEFLVDSGDVGQNIGFPNTNEEVTRYLEMLTTACPEITAEEQTLLRNKLEARRVADVNTE